MSCGGRHFCVPGCGQELIHRDNRKMWEAASAFGQIVNRIGPVQITCGDIDLYVWKSLPGRELLLLVEHKQPGQQLKPMQAKVLLLLDSMMQHAAACPDYTGRTIDPRSGVYIIRGAVAGGTDQHRTTNFQGPQTVTPAVDGKFDPSLSYVLNRTEDVFRWLEGAWKTTDRAGPRREPRRA